MDCIYYKKHIGWMEQEEGFISFRVTDADYTEVQGEVLLQSVSDCKNELKKVVDEKNSRYWKQIHADAKVIRETAAKKWGCEVSEIDYPSCVGMAIRGEVIVNEENKLQVLLREAFSSTAEGVEKTIAAKLKISRKTVGKFGDQQGKEIALVSGYVIAKAVRSNGQEFVRVFPEKIENEWKSLEWVEKVNAIGNELYDGIVPERPTFSGSDSKVADRVKFVSDIKPVIEKAFFGVIEVR